MGGVTLPSHANSNNAVDGKIFGGRLKKFTQVNWLGKEFHTTVVTWKFAKITILLLQCSISIQSLRISTPLYINVVASTKSKLNFVSNPILVLMSEQERDIPFCKLLTTLCFAL